MQADTAPFLGPLKSPHPVWSAEDTIQLLWDDASYSLNNQERDHLLKNRAFMALFNVHYRIKVGRGFKQFYKWEVSKSISAGIPFLLKEKGRREEGPPSPCPPTAGST